MSKTGLMSNAELLEKLSMQIKSLRSEMNERFERVDQRLDSIERKLDHYEEHLADLPKGISELRGEPSIEPPPRQRERKRKPFTFESVDIPTGSELEFESDRTKKVIVLGGKNVSYSGESMTIGKAANKFLDTPDRPTQGIKFFLYKGRLLVDLYEQKVPKRHW